MAVSQLGVQTASADLAENLSKAEGSQTPDHHWMVRMALYPELITPEAATFALEKALGKRKAHTFWGRVLPEGATQDFWQEDQTLITQKAGILKE